MKYKQPHPAKYGEIHKLVTPELLTICSQWDIIGIAGPAKSGKNIVCKTICIELQKSYLFTDTYQELSWDNQPKAIIDDIKPNTIVSGVTVPRVLRYGLTSGTFIPDGVIYLRLNNESTAKLFSGKELDKAFTFNKGLFTTFQDWLDHPKNNTPVIYIDTSFEDDWKLEIL